MLQLSDIDIHHVQDAYPILLQIQQKTGVPWQALAGIWYRESFSMTPPTTPGGPWQFDPPPTDARIVDWLNRYTNLDDFEKGTVRTKGVNNFYTGGILAACHMQESVNGVLKPDCPDNFVKSAIYSYNGRAYKNADDSPYVMNGFDADHNGMHLRGSIPNGHGGRSWIDIIDHRPGAFVVYKQLKALFP